MTPPTRTFNQVWRHVGWIRVTRVRVQRKLVVRAKVFPPPLIKSILPPFHITFNPAHFLSFLVFFSFVILYFFYSSIF